jgi:predicted MFS family arabinose efflux permease
MKSASGIRNIVRVLSHPNFGIYTAGNAVSLTGTWMQRIVTGWLTWDLTQSATWLGIIAFADLFPTVLLGPIGGAFVDRWDRLRVTKITQLIAMLQATALFALTVTGHITPLLLLVLTAFLGIVAAFNQPARLALTPALVPSRDLTSAVAINSLVFNLARFLGPAAAGLIIAAAGVPVAYAVNALTFLAFFAAISKVRLDATTPSSEVRTGLFSDLAAGLRYTASHVGIASVLVLMIAGNIGARPLIELLPGFAADVFDSGATGLAVLTSSVGFGAILAGIWLGGRGDQPGLARILMLSSLLLAFSAALFVGTERLWVGAPILVVTGFAMASAGIAAQTLIQISVDASMRGRVLGIYSLLFRGGPAIGAVLMGAAADYVGFRPPILAGALAILIVVLWARLRERRMVESLGQA